MGIYGTMHVGTVIKYMDRRKQGERTRLLYKS